MNRQKMIDWIVGDNTGVSSRTIWAALMGADVSPNSLLFDVPYDAADFGRCYNLVLSAEITRDELEKVPLVFPYWKPVIDIWDELSGLYSRKKWKAIYRRMDEIMDDVRRLKGYTKIGEEHWIKSNRI